jgi:hypothetical protein
MVRLNFILHRSKAVFVSVNLANVRATEAMWRVPVEVVFFFFFVQGRRSTIDLEMHLLVKLRSLDVADWAALVEFAVLQVGPRQSLNIVVDRSVGPAMDTVWDAAGCRYVPSAKLIISLCNRSPPWTGNAAKILLQSLGLITKMVGMVLIWLVATGLLSTHAHAPVDRIEFVGDVELGWIRKLHDSIENERRIVRGQEEALMSGSAPSMTPSARMGYSASGTEA